MNTEVKRGSLAEAQQERSGLSIEGAQSSGVGSALGGAQRELIGVRHFDNHEDKRKLPMLDAVTLTDTAKMRKLAQEAPTMLAVCAYCKGEIGRVACEPGQEGDVSHGICPSCFKAQTGREPSLKG